KRRSSTKKPSASPASTAASRSGRGAEAASTVTGEPSSAVCSHGTACSSSTTRYAAVRGRSRRWMTEGSAPKTANKTGVIKSPMMNCLLRRWRMTSQRTTFQSISRRLPLRRHADEDVVEGDARDGDLLHRSAGRQGMHELPGRDAGAQQARPAGAEIGRAHV